MGNEMNILWTHKRKQEIVMKLLMKLLRRGSPLSHKI
jgi:hypothetical protein